MKYTDEQLKTPDEIARECAEDIWEDMSRCIPSDFETMSKDKFVSHVVFIYLDRLTDALAEAREENERLRNYLGCIGSGAYLIEGRLVDVPPAVAELAREALDADDN